MKKKIELASQIDTQSYEDISTKFFPKIFGIESPLITDESILSDFYSLLYSVEIMQIAFKPVSEAFWTEDERKRINKENDKVEKNIIFKIKKEYLVDISDMERYLLIDIFKRIQILNA